MLAEVIISCITTVTSHGNPPPPNSGGKGTAPQPASTYCRYASRNPGGVVTLPSPSTVLPVASPTRLSGPTTSAMNRPLSSITPNTVSGSAWPKASSLDKPSRSTSSSRTNLMSRSGGT